MNIWFTSDTHFAHKNLCLGSTEWPIELNPDALRDFKDQWHMSDHLVNQINKYVKEDDILYHVGDWSFGGPENIKLYRDRIVCKTIHLVLGNHDDYIMDNIVVGEYQSGQDTFLIRAQDLFASVSDRKVVKRGKKGRRMILDHYAMRTWHHAHKGSYQLHGHSHASLELPHRQNPINSFYNKYRTMDVGMDNAKRIFGEYKPFHYNWILEYLEPRPSLGIDHHDPNNSSYKDER